MIYPLTVLGFLDGRFFLWLRGENRSGKTRLAMDIATYYLDDGYRLISNLDCQWNEDIDSDRLPLDENNALNAVVILDEAGTFMRTKESIRQIMGFKGKLQAFFILPSTEEPHEDLWRFYCEPAEGWNAIIKILFGSWIVENFFMVWRSCRFNPSSGKADNKNYFVQINAKVFHGIYSTSNPFNNPENILSQFNLSLQELYTKVTGRSDIIKLQDVATKRTGMGETQSFFQHQVDQKNFGQSSGILHTKKKRH